MKRLFLPLLLLVAVSAHAAENPVLTIEGGKVQGVLADDHPDVYARYQSPGSSNCNKVRHYINTRISSHLAGDSFCYSSVYFIVTMLFCYYIFLARMAIL